MERDKEKNNYNICNILYCIDSIIYDFEKVQY